MIEQLNKCNICPHKCGVNRNLKNTGRCKATDKVKIALYSIHDFEEPCISGKKGSGTVFFSNCNLNCIYCQNYEISQLGKGREITIEELSNIFLLQQEKDVENINLVTPTSYVPQIIEAIKIARKKGLSIPIIYNTSGYDRVESLKLLEGLIDIYLPDFKYYNDKLGKYSNISNYFETASLALKEMYRQVGKLRYNKDGILVKGMIVRHLVLPNNYDDSKKIIKYLYDYYKDNIIISIMNQYTIIRKLEYSELNDKVDEKEYDEIINYAYDLGVRNAFIQEDSSQSDSFIPLFKGDMII